MNGVWSHSVACARPLIGKITESNCVAGCGPGGGHSERLGIGYSDVLRDDARHDHAQISFGAPTGFTTTHVFVEDQIVDDVSES